MDGDLGGGDDSFTATVLPDTRAHRTGEPCLDFAIFGGGGRDTFMLNVGNAKVDPNNPNAPLPSLNAELEASFDGGGGNDTILIGLLNVALSNPSQIVASGGDGNDRILIGMLNVAHPGGMNIVADGGAGNDELSLNFRGQLIGKLDVTLDGEEGNDAIDAVFNLVGQSDGTLNATVNGGSGNDKLRRCSSALARRASSRSTAAPAKTPARPAPASPS